jgi:hypothetical protein
MQTTAKRTILRIETWHALMLLVLMTAVWATKTLDPTAILAGGLFMGLNFLLLGYGVAWLIAPLAGRKRVKSGVTLLVLKIAIFLALLSTLFFRFDLDPISFAAGFSTLVLAIIVEAARAAVKAGS